MQGRTVLTGLIMLGALGTPAGAGTIEGRLWVSKQAARTAEAIEDRAAKDEAVGRRAAARRIAVARLARDVTDAVVYVEEVPRAVERRLNRRPWWSRRPATPRIVHAHQRFLPAVLAAPVGTAVRVQNLDRIYHHAFGITPDGTLELGAHAPGSADTLTFRRSGVVHLFCRLHSDELGFVVVVPNRAFARPDSLGRFTLRKLAPGTYRVRAWHPRLGTQVREVQVRSGENRVEIAFAP